MHRHRALVGLAVLLLAGALPGARPAGAQPAGPPPVVGYSVQSDATGKAGDHLFRIDMRTGVATDVGDTGFDDVESLAFDFDCKTLYGVDDVSDRLLACNPATGACRAVGKLGVDITDTGLAVAADGVLYMSTDAPKNPSRLYRLDPSTGHATAVGSQGQEVTGLAAAGGGTGCPSGLYGLGGDGRNNLLCIDTDTGQARLIGPLANVTLSDGGLDFAADGTLWGIDDTSPGKGNPSQVFTLDRATGAATVVSTLTANGKPINGFEGLAIDQGICAFLRGRQEGAAEIPATGPTGLVFLALALAAGGLLALHRRIF